MIFKKSGNLASGFPHLHHTAHARADKVRRALLDHASLLQVEHAIDTDAQPFIPAGWSIVEHRKHGSLRWRASDVALWSSARQGAGNPIGGNDLRRQLQGKPVLNATVLDYLFEHPDLIPPSWEGQCVFFWGTVYRRHSGLAVRALVLKDGVLNFISRRLSLKWFPGSPAAIFATP